MHPSFIEALSRNGESLVNQGNTLAQRLNAVLDERNRRHFAQTIAHLDQATAELVALEQSLKPALAELPATIAATRSTMEASHSLLLDLNDLAVSALCRDLAPEALLLMEPIHGAGFIQSWATLSVTNGTVHVSASCGPLAWVLAKHLHSGCRGW
ncbi:MAG: hypothetical protein RE468_12960 [Acidithiobacillus caldus]|uniref:hypothetical protein n=1 Tax=Acidithiobacillus caldus TaxID=33059 RepID=UPI00281635FF|nr:hypothetical protein [Acidithiobacillus caldus]WMT46771.1 MAG: hypothetical protein RE468_12960 [Acidithiobacillus caldus]